MSLKAKVLAVSAILSEAMSPETILQKMQVASVMFSV
jgi:ferredoxin-fold anticodon binding domain-containing protein